MAVQHQGRAVIEHALQAADGQQPSAAAVDQVFEGLAWATNDQPRTALCANPVFSMVGTSGRLLARLSPMTASARSRPSWISGKARLRFTDAFYATYHRQMTYRSFTLSLRILIAVVAWVLHPRSVDAAGPKGPQVTYRVAKYAFMNASQIEVEWEYPVFIAGTVGKPDKLNAWVRKQSLLGFEFCIGENLQALLGKTDDQVVEFLRYDPGFAECAAVRSIIDPTEAFGKFMTFRQLTASFGQGRTYQKIESLTFDMKSNAPTEIEALFKPGALAELNDALAEVIAGDRPDCHGRNFGWSKVSLRPPNEIYLEFAYDHGWGSCGDGVEVLRGRVVSDQLLRPTALRPVRELVRPR